MADAVKRARAERTHSRAREAGRSREREGPERGAEPCLTVTRLRPCAVHVYLSP